MPERQRGRDPNKQPDRRQERKKLDKLLPDYYRAVKYPDENTSNTAYEQTRELVYDAPSNLSAFRTLLLPNNAWHLIVLGQTPSEKLQSQIIEAMGVGERVDLPNELLIPLNLRRLEQSMKGEWVEHRAGRRRLKK